MKKRTKFLKIAILEDSEFYNRILSQRLENFTTELASFLGFHFQVESYAHPGDFIRNLQVDTDIAFIDYFLGTGTTGSQIATKVEQKCRNCKVVIISQSRRALNHVRTGTGEMAELIFKDQYAIPKTCFIVEELAKERFGQGLQN